MLNHNSLRAVEKARFSNDFCKPLYGSYCFSRIPATLQTLLTGREHHGLPQDAIGDGGPYEVVILLFIDGFGWRFFEKYAPRYPFLHRFVEQGIATKITSQFPSTTANHVTCINTGLSVGESGVYEWFYYEPKVDRVIAPLLFSFAGDKEPGTLEKSGIAPEEIYPRETLYQKLAQEGIDSCIVQLETIAYSPYSRVTLQGAQHAPYLHLSDGLKTVYEKAASQRGRPLYIYFYFGDIDSVGHRQGVASPEYEKAVHYCWTACEELLWKQLSALKKKSACIVVADHGMASVDPKETFYVNEEMPEIKRWIKRSKKGEMIVPAGSCRDFFLHIEEEHLAEAEEKLRNRIGSRGEVFRTEQLIAQKFFGEKGPSKRFLERVGNLVLVPHGHHGLWWHEPHRFDQHFYGAHGGLTRDEMETIFLFQEI